MKYAIATVIKHLFRLVEKKPNAIETKPKYDTASDIRGLRSSIQHLVNLNQ